MGLTKTGTGKFVLMSVVAGIFFMLADYAYSATDPMEAMGILSFDKPEKAPDFTLKNVSGESVSLSDYKGKALFVTFWATW